MTLSRPLLLVSIVAILILVWMPGSAHAYTCGSATKVRTSTTGWLGHPINLTARVCGYENGAAKVAMGSDTSDVYFNVLRGYSTTKIRMEFKVIRNGRVIADSRCLISSSDKQIRFSLMGEKLACSIPELSADPGEKQTVLGRTYFDVRDDGKNPFYTPWAKVSWTVKR